MLDKTPCRIFLLKERIVCARNQVMLTFADTWVEDSECMSFGNDLTTYENIWGIEDCRNKCVTWTGSKPCV